MSPHYLIVLGGMLASISTIISITSVSASTNLLSESLRSFPQNLSTVTSMYLVAKLTVMPLVPIWMKLYSPRKVTLIATTGFIIANILCALSQHLDSLVVARTISGIFSGIIAPIPYIFIKSYCSPKEQADMLLKYSKLAIFAPLFGALFVFLLTAQNVYWIFILNAAIAGVALLLIAINNPVSMSYGKKNTQPTKELPTKDTLLTILFCMGIGAFIFTVESGAELGWMASDIFVFGLLFSCAILCVSIAYQLQSNHQLIAWELLGKFDSAIILICGFFTGVIVYGLLYFVPYYLSVAHNASIEEIVEVLIYTSITQIFMMPIITKIRKKVPSTLQLFVGILLSTCSVLLFVNTGEHLIGGALFYPQVIRAVGVPMAVIALSTLLITTSPPNKEVEMSTLFTMFRTLGGAVGVATLTGLVSYRYQNHFRSMLNFHEGVVPEQASVAAWHYAFGDTFLVLAVTMALLTISLFLLHVKSKVSATTLTHGNNTNLP